MMGITKQKLGNEHEMSRNSLSHYSFFLGLFVAFTYHKNNQQYESEKEMKQV
ncbi:hypothetical protein KSP40_PGU000097 [Platanthera guangdongensis]|uniref:Photosystem II protein L n=1 Tax=Platanthera guangdongensis TaxID=2320717 RepID=A0ABR2LHJ5_9ASPA